MSPLTLGQARPIPIEDMMSIQSLQPTPAAPRFFGDTTSHQRPPRVSSYVRLIERLGSRTDGFKMENASLPRDYPDWRTAECDRAEDAAYLFGYYLILHCRDEAIATVPANASTDVKAAVEKAVDVALHNVCDMLEGFWPLPAGPKNKISLALGVQVRNAANDVVESIEISPCKLDLPIGYWKWAQDRDFR